LRSLVSLRLACKEWRLAERVDRASVVDRCAQTEVPETSNLVISTEACYSFEELKGGTPRQKHQTSSPRPKRSEGLNMHPELCKAMA
jgi:hypothetical protein